MAFVWRIVDNTGDELWEAPQSDDLVFTKVLDLPAALTTPAGIAFGDGKWRIVDFTGSELWEAQDDDALSFTKVLDLPAALTTPGGIAFGDGKWRIVDWTSDELWEAPSSDDLNFTKVLDLPATLAIPTGITYGDGKWRIADSGGDDLWEAPQDDDLVFTKVLDLPVTLTNSTGITYGDGKWRIADSTGSELWEAPQSDDLVFTKVLDLPAALTSPAGIAYGNVFVNTDTDSIYHLGASPPPTPTGGTTTENHTPAGWVRTEPAPTATENVYRSQRIRTFEEGIFLSATAWGAPTKIADVLTAAWRIVDSSGDELWEAPRSDDLVFTKVLDFPAAITNPTGIAFGDGKWRIVDSSGDELWEAPLGDDLNFTKVLDLPVTLTNPFGIAFGDGKWRIVDFTGTELWEAPDSDDLVFTKVLDLPTTLTTPLGIAFGDDKWRIADSGGDELWEAPQDDDLVFTKVLDLPVTLTNPTGITYGDGKWRIADSTGSELWEAPQSDDLVFTKVLDLPPTLTNPRGIAFGLFNIVTTTDTDSIYISALSIPATPSGGTSTENHTPSGWQRTESFPTTTLAAYRSQRTRTYWDGAFNSATAWGTPTRIADRILVLSEWDDTGLEVDAAALIEASGAYTSGSSYATLYADSDRGGSDTPLDGEIGLGTDETLISRIRWNGTLLQLYDNNNPAALNIGSYFNTGGAGEDLTVYLQTINGEFSFSALDLRQSGTGAFVRFTPPSDFANALSDLEVGSRFIIAFARSSGIANIEAAGTLDAPTLAFSLAKTAPLAQSLEAAGVMGDPSLAAALTKTSPPAQALEASAALSAPSLVSSVTKRAADLLLADFDSTGLIVDAAALLESSGGYTSGSAYATLYADADRGGTDTPLDGEVGLGVDDTAISRIRWNGTILWFNDNNNPAALNIGSYFNTGGAGAALTVYLQTADDQVNVDFIVSPPGLQVDKRAPQPLEASAALSAPSLAVALTKASLSTQALEASSTLAAPSLASSVTKRAADLLLSDFDSTGLIVDAAALLESSGGYTSGSAYVTLYADADRGGTDTPLDGELGLGVDDTVISRIRWNGTILWFNDNNNPAALNIGSYFNTGGAGAALTVYLQTADSGLVTFEAAAERTGGTGAFVTFTPPAAVATLLSGISVGDRFIIAFARDAIANIEAAGTLDAPTLAFSLAKTAPLAQSLEAAGVMGDPSLAAALTKTSPPAQALEASAALPAPSLGTIALGKSAPSAQALEASATLTAPSLASSVTKRAADLLLADFDSTGLIVDAAALLESSGGYTSGSAYATLYADADRGGTDTPLDGEVGLGVDDTAISRIQWNGTILRLNDNNSPVTLNIGSYFNTGGAGAALTVYLQTAGIGVVTFGAVAERSSGSGGFINFTPPADAAALLNSISVGDRFILAFARDAIANIEAAGTLVAPALSAEVTLRQPAQGSLEASASIAAPSLSITVTKTQPPTQSLVAASAIGAPVLVAQVTLGDQPTQSLEAAGALSAPALTAAATKASPSTQALEASGTIGSPALMATVALSELTSMALEASATLSSPVLAALVTKASASVQSLEASAALPAPSLAVALTKASPPTQALEASAALSAPSLASSVTKRAADLLLSDFDSTGLIVDAAALLESSGGYTSGSAYVTLYADADRSGTDVPIDGELGLGVDDTVISRIQWNGTVLRLNDNNSPTPLLIGNYFNTGGVGADLTVYLQTADGGLATFGAVAERSSGSGGFVTFTPPPAVATLLNSISVGDLFILAFARQNIVEITASGTLVAPALSAEVTLRQPTPGSLEASAALAAPSLGSIAATKTQPPTQSLVAASVIGAPALAAQVTLGDQPTQAIEAAGALSAPALMATVALSELTSMALEASATLSSPALAALVTKTLAPAQDLEASAALGTSSLAATVTLGSLSDRPLEASAALPAPSLAVALTKASPPAQSLVSSGTLVAPTLSAQATLGDQPTTAIEATGTLSTPALTVTVTKASPLTQALEASSTLGSPALVATVTLGELATIALEASGTLGAPALAAAVTNEGLVTQSIEAVGHLAAAALSAEVTLAMQVPLALEASAALGTSSLAMTIQVTVRQPGRGSLEAAAVLAAPSLAATVTLGSAINSILSQVQMGAESEIDAGLSIGEVQVYNDLSRVIIRRDETVSNPASFADWVVTVPGFSIYFFCTDGTVELPLRYVQASPTQLVWDTAHACMILSPGETMRMMVATSGGLGSKEERRALLPGTSEDIVALGA